MVSQSGDFVSNFTPESEKSPLDLLNSSTYIEKLGSPITRIRWAFDGNTRCWWLNFENGQEVFVPSTKILRSPTELEILLTDTLGISVLLPPSKMARIWRQQECGWMMEAATQNLSYTDTLTDHLEELLHNQFYLYTGDDNSPVTGREAASLFAEQATRDHLEQRYIMAQGQSCLYLHFTSLSKVWSEKYGARSGLDNVKLALHRRGWVPTRPFPTKTGSASVRMWLKADVGEITK